MTIEFSEKRRHRRIPLTLQVNGNCRETKFQNHPFQGETQDISYEGLCIKVNSMNGFKIGQQVKFKTRLYQSDFLMTCQGEICWVRNLHDSAWPINMGMRLTKMRHYGLWVERIEEKHLELNIF